MRFGILEQCATQYTTMHNIISKVLHLILGFLFEELLTDLEFIFCVCDEKLQNGVDQGFDGVLSLQEFTSPNCQVNPFIYGSYFVGTRAVH